MTLKAVASESLSASGITIGSSVITGGTDTRVLFDDAGVVGESAGLTYLKATGKLSVGLTGSAAAWTTGGVRIVANAVSYTDTSSSGTVATAYSDIYGATTILASSATTYTQYYGAFFKAPVASTNVTMTNKSALGADTVSIGGQAQSSFALAVSGTSNFAGNVFIPSSSLNMNSVGSNGLLSNGNFLQLFGATGVQLPSLTVFGGTTASFPALKRSTVILQARLADDSGFAQIQGKLTTDTNATTGLVAGVLAATTNASIVITDASGQAYRIPCII